MEKQSTLPGFEIAEEAILMEIEEWTNNLMQYIADNCPDSRQRSIALTNYEQAAMWAAKSLFP